jgi:hypothetical protein
VNGEKLLLRKQITRNAKNCSKPARKSKDRKMPVKKEKLEQLIQKLLKNTEDHSKLTIRIGMYDVRSSPHSFN